MAARLVVNCGISVILDVLNLKTMRPLLSLLFLLCLAPATSPKLCAQESVQDAILAEGKSFYRLEKTA